MSVVTVPFAITDLLPTPLPAGVSSALAAPGEGGVGGETGTLCVS